MSKTLCQLNCTEFHFYQYEETIERASTIRKIKGNPRHNEDWLLEIFLPLLGYQDHQNSQAISEQAELHKKQKNELANLLNESDRLKKEIVILKQQAQSVGKLDIEQLCAYLPIIYRNFWNSIKPSDLAIIAGSYDIPDIPSPFPEPDRDTVAMMKNRLQQLPASEYQKIANLCRDLPHRLEVRPEMRFILED